MDKLLNKIKRIIPLRVFKFLQPVYHYFLALFSGLRYRWPSEELIVIGVTGTTGKTTSVSLIAKTLESAGYKVGFTSTAMFNDGEKEWLNDKKMTMVGRMFTQKILRQMVKNGCQYAIVETTSEGIRQFRHKFINYDILVFTGLYPEHIESHGSFEKYKEAKGALFAHLKKCGVKYIDGSSKVVKTPSGMKKLELKRVKKTIVGNGDDENAEYFFSFWAEERYMYSVNRKKGNKNWQTLNYEILPETEKGISFRIKGTVINMQLLGNFNVTNAMNAVAIGVSQSINLKVIKEGLEKIEGVAGRLEKIDEGQNFTVIVDYAFEPNALEKLYATIKYTKHNNIIHVLGSAGGGRDVARRPIMGSLAGKNANTVIITNEDPYDDDPYIIMDQVSIGAEKEGKVNGKTLFKILDRGKAIRKALYSAEEGDIVLITGKGSEQYIMEKNGEKVNWDDRAAVRGILNSMNRKKPLILKEKKLLLNT